MEGQIAYALRLPLGENLEILVAIEGKPEVKDHADILYSMVLDYAAKVRLLAAAAEGGGLRGH